jgi:NAD(P)-dependent dehydrogenase (short-subunit alcohol dehydrogenase family)
MNDPSSSLHSAQGRVVVITGATGGLGQAAAKAFAERGASLALLDKDQEKLDSLVRALNLPSERLFSRVVDLLDAPALHATAEAVSVKFGRLDILLHLAGGWTGGRTIPESRADELASMLDQHAWTTFNLFQSFVPPLIRNGWGRVVTVSLPLTVHPAPKMGPHAAGKAAQEALVTTLAEEVREQGITANIIHVQAIDVKGEGRGTTPAEIVAAMLYLCSEEAIKITGDRIPLYGV